MALCRCDWISFYHQYSNMAWSTLGYLAYAWMGIITISSLETIIKTFLKG